MSRSELYARAVAEFLAKHQTADITARLNQVYGAQDGRLDGALRRAQARNVAEREW